MLLAALPDFEPENKSNGPKNFLISDLVHSAYLRCASDCVSCGALAGEEIKLYTEFRRLAPPAIRQGGLRAGQPPYRPNLGIWDKIPADERREGIGCFEVRSADRHNELLRRLYLRRRAQRHRTIPALLGATGAVVRVVSGLGELLGYGLRIFSGQLSERTGRILADYYFRICYPEACRSSVGASAGLAGGGPADHS